MAVPKADYLSRDYAGLRESLLQYAAQRFPEWQPASEGDFGMLMVELFAYTGDVLSYYTDRAQFENYISTATQRDSVLSLAYLLGYQPNSGSPSRGTVSLAVDAGQPTVTVPAGTQITSDRVQAIDSPVTFEVAADTVLPARASGAAEVATQVQVVEGTSVAYQKIGSSNGQPSQFLTLPDSGVYRDTVRIFIEDSGGSTSFTQGVTTVRAREWTVVDHLLNADHNDFVFEAQLQDNTVVVGFGDDVNGSIPSTGLQIFASYRHGYGVQGNLGAGTVRFIDDRSVAGVHVMLDANRVPISSVMTGGTDPESTDSIRYNAPRVYRTQNRIVNKRDAIDAALAVPGVTKANAVSQNSTSITLFVSGPDGKEPTTLLKDKVTDALLDKVLFGVSVSTASPSFVKMNIGSAASPVLVEIQKQYSKATVEAAIRRSLIAFIGNMAFGDKFSIGNIYDAINEVEGVRHVEVPIMARDDATQVGVATVFPRDWEIFTPGTFYLNVIGGVA